MISFLVKIRDAVLNFLFPPHCVYCKTEGAFLCFACLKKLKISPSLIHHPEPPTALKGLVYAFKYGANPQLQKAIQQFKYKFNTSMADVLAALLLKKLNRLPARQEPIVLIPVPLHRKRYYERGFNQSMILAQAMQRLADLRVCEGLKRTRYTTQQAKLNRAERLKNLKGSFEVLPALSSVPKTTALFLVDDVHTTGTTLEECAKTLKKAGYKNVYGLVIAKA